ncbi:MAG: SpoIIE family protein phosphatase [Anaerolineae bacterium]|jgi:serine phosphatase RsbU (regulator of sigma subunit)|nr:SpoIIE family protein phosphatase [Chloroflexota bacterium]
MDTRESPANHSLEIQLGAAKVPRYATSISGDTLEMIERPQGGISAVLVDGQRSGRSARIISNIVARKAISLLGEGVRDGAAVRATHDYLRTHRGGQVSAELQMVSVDLVTQTLVISRNARCPSYIWSDGTLDVLVNDSEPIGIYDNTKPSIVELPLAPWVYVVSCTDGLGEAFETGQRSDLPTALNQLLAARPTAQDLADSLLSSALERQDGRPHDDVSVLVVAVLPNSPPNRVRRLSARFPVPPQTHV